MINLERLFASAPKEPARYNTQLSQISSSLPQTFSFLNLQRIESCSRDALFWYLVDKQIINTHGIIIAEVPTELPQLSLIQKSRLQATLNEPIPVLDCNGVKGFEISFNEIIQYVREYYHNHAVKPRIELVGGWVAKILDLTNDPLQILRSFNVPGIEEFLNKHPLEENYRNPADRDLRIDIQGASKEERKKLFDHILARIGSRTRLNNEWIEQFFLTDFSNPQDIDEKNCFLMFGMGDRKFTNIEVLAFDQLRRKDLFSLEVKISVDEWNFSCGDRTNLIAIKKVWQGLFDRILQKLHISEPETLDHFIFFKEHLYSLQGYTVSEPHVTRIIDEKFLRKNGEEIQQDIDRREPGYTDEEDSDDNFRSEGALLFHINNESLKILRKHCRQEPLNVIAYLHSLHQRLINLGKGHLFYLSWEFLKQNLLAYSEHGKIEFCKIEPENFEMFNHLATLLSWINSRGDGDARGKECRSRLTLKGENPSLELIIKGRIQSTPGHSRSDYSFWIPYHPSESWKFLARSAIPEELIAELFDLFVADLDVNRLGDQAVQEGWNETELLNLAITFIDSDSPSKFRIGFWITLLSCFKNPTLLNSVFKNLHKYFFGIEKQASIKAKAVSIFEKIRIKTNPQSSPKLSDLLLQGHEEGWLDALLNDPLWNQTAFDQWKTNHPKLDVRTIDTVIRKFSSNQSVFTFLQLIVRNYSDSVEIYCHALEYIRETGLLKDQTVPYDQHNSVIEYLLQYEKKKEAMGWIAHVGPNPKISLVNWRRILANVDPKNESSEEILLLQKYGSKDYLDDLWNFASVNDHVASIEKELQTNLTQCFNLISALDADGKLDGHFEEFRPVIVKALNGLIGTPFKSDGLVWEFLKAKNLILKYPSLIVSSEAKLDFLQKIVDTLQSNLKDYEKSHDPGWYVGLLQEFFALFIQECVKASSVHLNQCECIFNYLEKVNYLSHPMTAGMKEGLRKLAPKLFSELKARARPAQILGLHKLLNLRDIKYALSSEVYSALIYAYHQKAQDYSVAEIGAIAQLLEAVLLESPSDKDLCSSCLFLAQFVKNPALLSKLFQFLSGNLEDKSALHDLMQKQFRELIKDKKVSEALTVFESAAFEARRDNCAEAAFNLYVNEASAEESLIKGFELLKKYKHIPRNSWVVLVCAASTKCSDKIFEEIWNEYNNTADLKLKPGERGECWIAILKRTKGSCPNIMKRLVRAPDVVAAVFKVSGCESSFCEGLLVYLEGALKILSTMTDKQKFIPSIQAVQDELLKRKDDLSEEDKSRLFEVAMNLLPDQKLDQSSKFMYLLKIIPLAFTKDAIGRLSAHLKETLVYSDTSDEHFVELALGLSKELIQVPQYDALFETILKFCLQCKKKEGLYDAAKAVIIFIKTNNPKIKSSNHHKIKSNINLIKVLMNQLLDRSKDRIAEAYFSAIFTGLNQLNLISEPESKFTWALWTKYKLFNLIAEQEPGFPVLMVVFESLHKGCPEVYKTSEFKKYIFEFLEACLKKRFLETFTQTVSLIEYFTFFHQEECLNSEKIIFSKHTNYQIYHFKDSKRCISIHTTNLRKDFYENTSYSEALISFKFEYIEIFQRLYQLEHTKKNGTQNLHALSFLLDCIYTHYEIVVLCSFAVGTECLNRIAKNLETFLYMIDYNDDFIVPHLGHEVFNELSSHNSLNINDLFMTLLRAGVFGNNGAKYYEVLAYTGFNKGMQPTTMMHKFPKKDILDGIVELFRKCKNEKLYLNVLMKLPLQFFVKDFMTLFPLVITFFATFPEKKDDPSMESLMKLWIQKISEEILNFEDALGATYTLLNVLKSNVFGDRLKAININLLLQCYDKKLDSKSRMCLVMVLSSYMNSSTLTTGEAKSVTEFIDKHKKPQ